MSNNIDRQYLELVNHILRFGYDKQDRTGTGTKSIFGWQIRHRMSEGFPLLTTKKMAWKTMVTELLWFLRGDTNIKYLVDNDCHIWDGDAWKNFCNKHYGIVYITKEDFIERIKDDKEFAKKWGDLGPVYGKQWRSWNKPIGIGYSGSITMDGTRTMNEPMIAYDTVDQIANVINLLKTDPDSRRMIVNAWAVHDLENMVLPPCHMMFQFYTRELSWYDDLDKIKEIYIDWSLSKNCGGYAGDIKANIIESANQIFVDGWQKYKDPFTGKLLIELECFSSIPKRAISLMYYARSQDVPLGTPFNISSYSLLLMIIAKHVNMVPEELIANMGDCHIYNNQIEGIKEQLTRIPYDLPTVRISDRIVNDISEYEVDDFVLENYQYHPSIKLPLSN